MSSILIPTSTSQFVWNNTGQEANPLDFNNADLIIVTNNPGTISGLRAGMAGQRVTIVNRSDISLGRRLWLNHVPVPPNGLNSVVWTVAMPVMPTMGSASYIYNGATQLWDMYAFEQGYQHPTGPATSYPNWGMWRTAGSPQPSVGDATVTVGFYIRGQFVRWSHNYQFWSGTTFGNGIWQFTGMWPDAFRFAGGYGCAFDYDQDAVYPLAVYSDQTADFPAPIGSSVRLISTTTGQPVSATSPFVWEAQDSLSFTYEIPLI